MMRCRMREMASAGDVSDQVHLRRLGGAGLKLTALLVNADQQAAEGGDEVVVLVDRALAACLALARCFAL
jgi:hypothetical protein